MARDMRHLWQRGEQYYLRIPIPRPLQKKMLSDQGKPMAVIVKSLGDSAEAARRKRDRLIPICTQLFDRVRAGETVTQDQIKAALHLDLVPEMAREAPRESYYWPDSFPAGMTTREKMLYVEAARDAALEPIVQKHGLTLKGNPELRAALLKEIEERDLSAFLDEEASKNPTIARRLVALGLMAGRRLGASQDEMAQPAEGETINQAAEAWFEEMQRDPSAAVKQTTLDGHRLRVQAFVEHCGDIPLASVTRAMASDFLTKVSQQGKANRTTNNYATTMNSLFKSATNRGRFTGNNPFADQKRKAGGESYEAFTVPELQTLFDSFKFEIAPKHTPETALPWVSLIAAYTGMRLEEIAQLATGDIRDQGANGSTVTVIDIHNGGNNALKNAASARLVPVHSALVRAGFLDYVKALPEGSLLFPGLKRRESKGNKIGARLGELFRKKLEALALKRDRLCFHSFRHTVAEALEAAAVSQTDAARVLGHTIPGMSYGVYSSGPGLKRLAGVVEEIAYPGLRLSA